VQTMDKSVKPVTAEIEKLLKGGGLGNRKAEIEKRKQKAEIKNRR